MATTMAHAKARVVDSFSDKTAVVVFSSSIPSAFEDRYSLVKQSQTVSAAFQYSLKAIQL